MPLFEDPQTVLAQPVLGDDREGVAWPGQPLGELDGSGTGAAAFDEPCLSEGGEGVLLVLHAEQAGLGFPLDPGGEQGRLAGDGPAG
ncbi:hypothetical protein [Streptomyces sp. NPDC047046]|uniref:hypothetical protein n=1 Tax=Streptomyces sp. NPDC047046 TaxID=3155378 RepID=UPI0033CCCBF9